MRPHTRPVSTPRLAFGAALALVCVAILSATLLVRSEPPSCPVDAWPVGDTSPAHCGRGLNPTDAPSSIEFFLASDGGARRDRALILGVGLLGSIFLVGLGLRLLARESTMSARPVDGP
jgi:hypothetical protein